jgi:hypothetical protein
MRGAASGPMTIVTNHDHGAFSIIIAGYWDILVVIVLEGKGEIKTGEGGRK